MNEADFWEMLLFDLFAVTDESSQLCKLGRILPWTGQSEARFIMATGEA
jgi:uncharacterized membrane protein